MVEELGSRNQVFSSTRRSASEKAAETVTNRQLTVLTTIFVVSQLLTPRIGALPVSSEWHNKRW